VSDRPRYAIIPSNGRECLDQAIEAIYPQVDRVLITWTSAWDGRRSLPRPDDDKILYAIWRNRPGGADPAPNISAWWNEGLENAKEISRHDFPSRTEWDVAILNDDAIVSEDWFERISRGMRRHGGAAASSGARHGITEVLTEPGPVPGWPNPLQGYAFMLAGEKGLRANEDLHWYFTDNYIDWESRKLGGTVILPVCSVQHLYPNGQMDHDLQVRTGVDAQVFVDLYGMRPW
jgi:hypothetical protein